MGATGEYTKRPPLERRTTVIRILVVTLVKARVCGCSKVQTLSFSTCSTRHTIPLRCALYPFKRTNEAACTIVDSLRSKGVNGLMWVGCILVIGLVNVEDGSRKE